MSYHESCLRCYCSMLLFLMDGDDWSNNLSKMEKGMSTKMTLNGNECDEKDNDQICQFSSC